MSLATTCPACGTAFLVTTEQLSIHRGDVRCGKCQHVFNALQHLSEVAIHSNRGIGYNPNEALTRTVSSVSSFPSGQLAERPQEEPRSDSGQSTSPERVQDSKITFQVGSPASGTNDFRVSSNGSLSKADSPDALDMQPSEVTATLSRHPTFSLVKALLTLLLSAGAVFQTVYFMRSEIAAKYPPTKKWLEQGCMWLNCTVDLPRYTEPSVAVVIEDSDLKDDPDRPGTIQLDYVLFNRASVTQAYPMLELTLSDTSDKPVLRRTLVPAEYLPKGLDPRLGIGGRSETSSHLYLEVSGEKPTGYRLWLKY